jgi:hypothetical protein
LRSFATSLFLYGEELLAPRPTPELEDHSLSAARDCLFNIFAATLHIWRASPPSATWGRAMPWRQGTHVIWRQTSLFSLNKKRFRIAATDAWKLRLSTES